MQGFFAHDNVASVLNTEFDRRKRKNDSYSLRAFARDLEISPSRLSEILKGSNGLSEKSANHIATKLKLKNLERKFLLDLVLAESARNGKVRELAQVRLADSRKLKAYQEIKENQFHVIADWYHGAILELPQVQGFQNNYQWVSQRLGITVQQAEDAVKRLQSLGLLEISKDGNWKVRPEAYSAFSETPSVAIRNS
jgi:uncharacterized protein (TIGR02147 family)